MYKEVYKMSGKSYLLALHHIVMSRNMDRRDFDSPEELRDLIRQYAGTAQGRSRLSVVINRKHLKNGDHMKAKLISPYLDPLDFKSDQIKASEIESLARAVGLGLAGEAA